MAEPTALSDVLSDVSRAARQRAEAARRRDEPLPQGPSVEDYEIDRGSPPVPRRFVEARTSDLDDDAAKLVSEWSEGGMTANVLLLGTVGVGKTHTACALAREAWEAGRGVWFQPVVELLDRLRPDGDPNAMDKATGVDVLVLDDLGGERPTDWTGERLYAIVNRRWLEQRPTIVTANLSAPDLERAVGPRVWSRLYHQAIRLAIGGDDRRKAS